MNRQLWILLALLIAPYPSTHAATTENQDQETIEVRVLIDISGSMKQSDPNNLRTDALNLFISLLPTGTKAGVWTFGQWVNMLTKPSEVNEQWKIDARLQSKTINSHGMLTDIESVMNIATWDWKTPAPQNAQRHLILLTDGLVDISQDSAENSSSRDRIIQTILPRLQTAGVRIHTIALSNKSDIELLQHLSSATGGWFESINSANELTRLFSRLFQKVSASNIDTLPLDNNRVSIDDSVKEATFLIFHDSTNTSISAPSNTSFTINDHPKNISWHSESQYDLVTISIQSQAIGK